MWVIHNNEIILESELNITSSNRAFLYGDGFFETIGVKDGEVRFLKDHLSRVRRGAKVLSFDLPKEFSDEGLLSELIKNLLSKNSLNDCGAIVKIIIWRKEGGKYEPQQTEVEYLIKVGAKSWDKEVKVLNKLALYNDFVNVYSPISSIKSISSSNYVLAGIYKKENELEDLIILGEDRTISECLYSNIFWFENEVLYTPSYLTGCIDGVMKKQILKSCIENGISFQEGAYGLNDLLEADFVFNANVSGFNIIESFEGKKFELTMPLFDKLIKKLK